jgi:LytS/YehU family sensor histidine kinase
MEDGDYQQIVQGGPMKIVSYAAIPPRALLFYLNVFLFVPAFFLNKKWFHYFGYLLVLAGGALGIELLILKLTGQVFDSSYLVIGSVIYGFYIAVSLAYGIIRHQIQLERQQQVLEKEKLSAELKLMRSQINPHFLFNALNNLLAISERHKQQEISEGISRLSYLLRFIIYDTRTDFIPLEKEVEFIKDYIELNSLRYDKQDPIEVSFNVSGDTDGVEIAPTLLIPFVENAYKHGIDIQKQSFVKIELTVDHNLLNFKVSNSVHNAVYDKIATQYNGVGLENVKKRLALIYKNKQELQINQADHFFNVDLKIELK